MARNMKLAPFIKALKEDSWTLDYDSVAGGGRTVQFSKPFGARTVEVQLWADGKHRASHMVYSDRARQRGRMSTPPTEFRDVSGMWAAVQHECDRSDHPPQL